MTMVNFAPADPARRPTSGESASMGMRPRRRHRRTSEFGAEPALRGEPFPYRIRRSSRCGVLGSPPRAHSVRANPLRSVCCQPFASGVRRSAEHSGCIACQTARYPSSSTSAWGTAKDCGLAAASMILLSITSTMHSQRRRYSAREAAEAAVSVRIRISPQIVQPTGVSEQSPPPGSAHEDTFSRA
jgi:hypothetical protein